MKQNNKFMKNHIPLFVLIISSLLLFGCAPTSQSQATFGSGDTKFSVELVESNYLATDNPRPDVPDVRWPNAAFVRGNLTLKLCNKGQKEFPFVLTQDIGGIFIEFRPEDVADVDPRYLKIVETIKIKSDEGLFNLVPNTCPTYPFSFDSGGMGVSESEKLTKDAFKNAKYYFFIGDKKFPLTGKIDFAYKTSEQMQQESGISKDEAKTILTEVSQKVRLDECKEGTINDIPCLYTAWELAFKQYVPQGKEGVCTFIPINETTLIADLCKSGLKKNLTDLQARFDQLKS
jgi:hypothetical protein